MEKIFIDTTKAICPVCKELVDAKIYSSDNKVYLEKYCLEHGKNSALISSDYDYYKKAHQYVRPGQKQQKYLTEVKKGCPEDCGLCPEHEQHVCMPVIEINNQCNLSCPICIAEESERKDLTLDQIKKMVEQLLEAEGSIDVLNLSGGEPTLHPDYKKIIEYLSGVKEITKVSVSTNGLQFLKDPELLQFHKEKSVVASLQLDGAGDRVYQKLRGADLFLKKEEIIQKFIEHDLDCSLVMTVAKNINDTKEDFKYIYDLFMNNENILSLLFQPLVYTKEYNLLERITIPDVINLFAGASEGTIKSSDFIPLPCCHANCFSLVHLLKVAEARYLPLKKFVEKERYLDLIKNRSLFGADKESFDQIKDTIFDIWTDSANVCDCMKDDMESALKGIKSIVKEVSRQNQSEDEFNRQRSFDTASRKLKSVYIHHFMDVDTFDLNRLRRCCTVYPKADQKLYPLCSYNNLYRG